MKKITLLFSFLLATVSWQLNAQAVEDNFDSYNSGDDPTGWTKYQTEADDPGFIVTDSESNSAPNSLYHNDDNVATESTSWIVAPVYVSTGDDMLEFFYRQNYTATYYNYSGVWYSTTGSDPIQNPGDWTQIAEFNDTDQPYSEDTWTQFRYTFNEAAGTNIYIAFKYTGDYAHEFYIDDFKIDVTPAYLNPEFDLSLTNVDCANSQFSVNVNVTNLGGASSVTVADDQGSATQQLSAPGSVTFGPYTSGTNVTFTVTNDDDTSFVSTNSISYTCPVNNDDCYNAMDLTVYDVGMGSGNETAIDAANFTDSGMHPSCDDAGTNIDMWFKVTVPAGETGFKAIYSGDKADKVEAALWDGCGGNELACLASSSNAYHTFTGLTAGTTYYLQLWLDSFNAGTFNVVIEKLPPAPNCADNPTPADGATVALTGPLSAPQVTLDWSDPTTGPTPDSYHIYLGTSPGNYTADAILTTHPITLTNAAENTTYYWKVAPISGGSEASGCPEWSFTTGALPAPVANSDCSGAVALNVDASACATPTVADNSVALDSGEVAPSCANYSGGDLWFTVTVPASGTVTIETSEVTGSNLTDTGMAVYSGTCGNLTEIDCDDDGGASTFSKIELTGQNVGDVLYVRVWEYGNDTFGEFNICAWDPNAGAVSENHIAGFKFYPNPVNHTLNLSAKNNIEVISISNVMGQEVLRMSPNVTETKVDMSQLQNGIYFVKAQVNGELTAFKVVKK